LYICLDVNPSVDEIFYSDDEDEDEDDIKIFVQQNQQIWMEIPIQTPIFYVIFFFKIKWIQRLRQ